MLSSNSSGNCRSALAKSSGLIRQYSLSVNSVIRGHACVRVRTDRLEHDVNSNDSSLGETIESLK